MWQIFLWTHCSWTLQNAPRDEDKLRRLLELKQRQEEEADHIEDTQRLVTERLKC
jgi:hypothetical protein